MKKCWLEAYWGENEAVRMFYSRAVSFLAGYAVSFFWMNVDRNHSFVIYCYCLPLWVFCTAYLPQKYDA
jgi:hypothetical protein